MSTTTSKIIMYLSPRKSGTQEICCTCCGTILLLSSTTPEAIYAKGRKISNLTFGESAYRDVCPYSVFDGMTSLCQTYIPVDLKRAKEEL